MATFIRCEELINAKSGQVRVHARDAFGDARTLCGYAYEGACTRWDDDHGVKESSRGRVDCETCLTIIRYCKRVPSTALS